MSNAKEIVTVLECAQQTDKAFLLKMYGRNKITGEEVEFEAWWPKSQVQYMAGDRDVEVPEWLLEKKLAEKFGPSAIIEVF
jgi:hypothetical protein